MDSTISSKVTPQRIFPCYIKTLLAALVGEVGLEPTKSKTRDLQSLPFAARVTLPKLDCHRMGLEPISQLISRLCPSYPKVSKDLLDERPVSSIDQIPHCWQRLLAFQLP